MVDQSRIEEIRLLPMEKAKVAMKAYAGELGVKVKARTIDNMVSEMNAQLKAPDMRAKGVTTFPLASNPLKGRDCMFYAVPEDIDNVDKCTFQWQFKASSASTFSNIDGATSQWLILKNVQDANLGQYKCAITEPGGTTTTSGNPSSVSTLAVVPVDFPEFLFYKATWVPFFGVSFAHVRWSTIRDYYKILKDDSTNNPPSLVHRTMDDHFSTVPLLDLISNCPKLLATDSRDGYKHLLSGDDYKDRMPKIFGRFNGNNTAP